jgi:hypothetical protein
MDKYFKGLPFEKVTLNGKDCYKGPDGCFYRIDERKKVIAVECAGDETKVEIDDFEDVDLFDKETEDSDMTVVVQSLLKEICS